MEKTRTTAKAKKERKFVTFSFDCDDATRKCLNEVADLAAVTLDQAVSVILALYVQDMKGTKSKGFEPQDNSPEEWTKDKKGKIKKRKYNMANFGLGK